MEGTEEPFAAPEVSPGDELEKYLTGEATLVEESADDVAKRIVAQVLSSKTVDEVLAPSEAVGLRDRLDIPLEIRGVSWHRSEFDVGTPFYAVMDAVNIDTGETEAITSGAQRVMAQLFKLAGFNAWPVRVVAKQSSRPSASGYYPLRLERVR